MCLSAYLCMFAALFLSKDQTRGPIVMIDVDVNQYVLILRHMMMTDVIKFNLVTT